MNLITYVLMYSSSLSQIHLTVAYHSSDASIQRTLRYLRGRQRMRTPGRL